MFPQTAQIVRDHVDWFLIPLSLARNQVLCPGKHGGVSASILGRVKQKFDPGKSFFTRLYFKSPLMNLS